MSNMRDNIIKNEFSHRIHDNPSGSWIDLYIKHPADLSYELLRNSISRDKHCKEFVRQAYHLTPDQKEYLMLL